MSQPYKVRETVYGHQKRLQFFKDQIAAHAKHIGHNPKVLDVGCGTGYMITTPLAHEGYDITGIDTDTRSINLAKKHNTLPTCQFREGLLEDQSDLRDFDVIICSEVLEHLHHPEKLLETIQSKIAPNGIILITVPNGYGWFELEQFLAKIIFFDKLYSATQWFKGKFYGTLYRLFPKLRPKPKPTPSSPQPPFTVNSFDTSPHVQRFTIKKFHRLANRYNLHIEKISSSSIFAGKISHNLPGQSDRFVHWTLNLADKLPPSLASNFFFLIKKK